MLFIPIITMLVVIIVGLIITRIATVALTYTGISRDFARFQARSAYSGVGFTTSESERIVRHPVRRRIVMILMLVGNAGIAAMVASMAGIMFTATSDNSEGFMRGVFIPLFYLFAALVFLWYFSSSKWIDDKLFRFIGKMLTQFTHLDIVDYTGVLEFEKGYRVSEVRIGLEHWLVGRTLAEARVSDEGIQVLAIHREDGLFVPTPTGNTYVRAGDLITIYGLADSIRILSEREKGDEGDAEYAECCAAHLERIAKQHKKDDRPPADEDRSSKRTETSE